MSPKKLNSAAHFRTKPDIHSSPIGATHLPNSPSCNLTTLIETIPNTQYLSSRSSSASRILRKSEPSKHLINYMSRDKAVQLKYQFQQTGT
jgi:hypothetical protein